jgi:xylulokinase
MFMLGGEAAVDYTLANRTLLFDLEKQDWSDELLELAGLDRDKLPRTVPSGTKIGTVSAEMAEELGLTAETVILTGAHDQCANSLGCGVVGGGSAMYGMGTFVCIAPVFEGRKDTARMLRAGLNTEHHAVGGKYITFIYNMGGSIIKWFRDTYAAEEHRRALASGGDVYNDLFSEVPPPPSKVMVLPHFAPMGPPSFIANSTGAIFGLTLETSRGEILRGIVEGNNFSLKECIELLPEAGIEVSDYKAVGGGSKSDVMVQMCANILEKPFIRPRTTEAGALGAAILAGLGVGIFSTPEQGVEAMVSLEDEFHPDPKQFSYYREKYERYKELWPRLGDYLPELNKMGP